MDEASQLSLIIAYDMTEKEAKAYKISLMYMEKLQKFFPKNLYRNTKSDPRKTLLFKCCYTLLREHGHELSDKDLKLYIHAQFDILRLFHKNNNHSYISPNILISDKSWKRWLLWKSRYDKIKKFVSTKKAEEVIDVKTNKIIQELRHTKDALKIICGELSKEKIINCLNSKEMFLWVRWGKVSNYYVVLSPLIKQWIGTQDISTLFSFEASVYQSSINPEVKSFFKEEFLYEF